MVTHESPGDTFWTKVQSGAKQAAADTGVTLKYSNDPDAARQSTLVQNGIDSKVNGIAVTLANPDAMAGSVKAAGTAGIPVVALNAGLDQYQKVGAQMYFGSDESVAGQAAGKRIAEAGAKHVLCVIQEAGNIALETRCAGVKQGVSNTENIQVTGTDDASVVSTLQAKLAQDKSIDYIVTLGAPIALDALKALDQAGSSAKLATFDLNVDAAQNIKDGKIEFSVDQQPYLQGYLAVTSLYLAAKNGNDVGGGKPVLTGPSFVDSSNIDQILEYAKNNTR
jgi:simple sugar transport system substrate-binding protein